jgi:hypothetical protein
MSTVLHIDGQNEPAKITAEQFEREYAERSGVTVEWLKANGRVVRPCDCHEEDCEGWQSVSSRRAAEIDDPSKPWAR